jgi:hypothetical protein
MSVEKEYIRRGLIKMVKVFYGKKGMGKTKVLIDEANNLAKKSEGDVVFIDYSSQLIYDLAQKVRFINVNDFPVSGAETFIGFLCGIISGNYDIEGVFIDGLTYIVKQDPDTLESFFNGIKNIAAKYNIRFFITITGDPKNIPEFMKEFIV